jgi:type I restriction enzyme, S subunit
MSKLLVDGTYAINIVKLKDIAEKKTTKNIHGLVTETFTNSAENGIISQSDFFDRTITNDKNISGYYIVEPDDFVYNPRISTFAPVGPINRNKLGRSGVMSPLYLVFHTHDVEPEYLEWYFKSNAWHQFMRDNGNTGARSDRFSISDAEFFNMPIPIPPVKVQKAIAKTLTTLDTKVTLEKNEVEKFQNLKSAMLTKMFPKKGGNVPGIRFDGFTDVWEQRKFEEIAVRSSVMSDKKGLPRVEYEDIISGAGRLNKDIKLKESEKVGIVFHKGDVLYGKLRPYLQNWLLASFNGLAVGDFWVLQPQNTDSSFLYRLVQSQQFDEVANQSTGTKMPRADWKLVSKTKFAMPHSVDEQAAIGAYFEHLDTLITLHQRKYEKLIDTKKAFLEKLIGGEK